MAAMVMFVNNCITYLYQALFGPTGPIWDCAFHFLEESLTTLEKF
jgi:hypothetical protein